MSRGSRPLHSAVMPSCCGILIKASNRPVYCCPLLPALPCAMRRVLITSIGPAGAASMTTSIRCMVTPACAAGCVCVGRAADIAHHNVVLTSQLTQDTAMANKKLTVQAVNECSCRLCMTQDMDSPP